MLASFSVSRSLTELAALTEPQFSCRDAVTKAPMASTCISFSCVLACPSARRPDTYDFPGRVFDVQLFVRVSRLLPLLAFLVVSYDRRFFARMARTPALSSEQPGRRDQLEQPGRRAS